MARRREGRKFPSPLRDFNRVCGLRNRTKGDDPCHVPARIVLQDEGIHK